MERPFLAYKGEEPYIFASYAHAEVYPELTRLRDAGFNVWYKETSRASFMTRMPSIE